MTPDDNIIARNTVLCLLAVRMNFGVSDKFCVRQIVMGNFKIPTEHITISPDLLLTIIADRILPRTARPVYILHKNLLLNLCDRENYHERSVNFCNNQV